MSLVVLAMSGGVDSSVAAHLLQEAGHEVIGVFMRHGESSPATACSTGGCSTAVSQTDGRTGSAPADANGRLPIVRPPAHRQGCCSASDAEDARRVAERLDIPFYALNLQAEFSRIIDYFVEEYTAGRTPNPCVVCNNWLKFGKLFDYADSVGADFVATGHYARLTSAGPASDSGLSSGSADIRPSGETCAAEAAAESPALRRGVDGSKDQSYVLFGIDRGLLRRMLLPVGGYRKSEIRRLAASLGLRVADKRDSQEICFVARGRHAEFVRSRSGNVGTAGELVTTDGRVVGTHVGIEQFTIGQRKGLGVALGEPRYVVRIEAESRRVVLGRKQELERRELLAGGTNWLVDPPPGPWRCAAKIRYNTPAAPATAELLSGNRLRVAFDEPRHGVAPGQAVVCYDGDRVLGGGWIE